MEKENKILNKSSKFLIASDLIYTIKALFSETFFGCIFFKYNR